MIELLKLSLFGSTICGLLVLALFILICFISEVNENGYIAFASFLAFLLSFYIFGKESWYILISFFSIKALCYYIIFGWIHSFIRVYFYGRNQMKILNEDRKKGVSYEHRIERNIKDHILRWWLLWPVSLLSWFIQDMVKDIFNWIYQRVEKLFTFVLELGIKSIPEEPKKDKTGKNGTIHTV
jgi:hypothetical protein